MAFSPNEIEIACIKRLAELYEIGQVENGEAYDGDPEKDLGLRAEQRDAVLAAMQIYGAITTIQPSNGIRFFQFRISPHVVKLARKIREKEEEKGEPRNIVEEINKKARSNSFAALA